MWKFEWKKLWGNKVFTGLLLACFLLNGVFFYWQMQQFDPKTLCFPEEIEKVYKEVEDIPKYEKAAWLESEAEKELNSEMPNWERRRALLNVADYMQDTLDYEGYLTRMKEHANQIAHSSLFSDAGDFSKRNAAHILKQYTHLEGLELEPENSAGILAATESTMTNLFLIAIIILFAYFVICVEREEGTMSFVHCMKNGARRLGMVKATIIFWGTILSTLLLYGTNFLLAGVKYDYGNLGRWIQSIEGYLASPWKMSVGTYFLCFFVAKIVVAAMFAALIMWMLLKGRSILESSVILVGVTVVEYLLYSKIETLSWLGILKQCNLFYLLGVERFWKSYDTINLFNYPVSSLLVCGMFGFLILLFFGIHSIWCYEKVSRSEYTMKNRKWSFPILQKRTSVGKSLWYYEGKKILKIHKVGMIFLAFLILQLAICQNKKEYFSERELYYRYYIGQIEGEVKEEKLQFLETEGERIQNMKEEYANLYDNPDNLSGEELEKKKMNLEERLKCKDGYEWVTSQAERIGKEGVFLDEVAFGRLLEKSEILKNIGMLLIVFVLAFYPVFIVERTSGMDTIWNSIPNGRKKIHNRKWTILIICTVLVCVFSDSIVVWYDIRNLDITTLNLSVQYLPGFEMWKGITVQTYLVIQCLIKIMVGIGVAVVSAVAAKKAKNATSVLLIVAGIAVLGYVIGNIIY